MMQRNLSDFQGVLLVVQVILKIRSVHHLKHKHRRIKAFLAHSEVLNDVRMRADLRQDIRLDDQSLVYDRLLFNTLFERLEGAYFAEAPAL